MPRECGSCSLCCKLLAIEELNKPANAWCPHCQPGHGCGTYATRPQSCQDFACLWLQWPEIPDSLQPSLCKAVLGYTADGRHVVVYQNSDYPQVYLHNPELRAFINLTLSRGIDVFIVTGEHRKMLPAKRSTNLIDINMHLPDSAPEQMLR